MKSFSIFGDCVSRDILRPGIREHRYKAKQYVSFINPYSLFTEPYEGDYPKEKLIRGTDFMKRNLEFDFRKTALDFLFLKPADYIVINPLDCRMGLYKKQGSTITNSNIIRTNPDFVRWLHKDGWNYMPFDAIAEDKYLEANEKFISLVLEHYRPEQIIVHVHYGVSEYARNEYEYAEFSDNMQEITVKYNALCQKLFTQYECIEGAHIIPFPERTYADFRNIWGLMPLHYTENYYQYGDLAVQTILQNKKKEKVLLGRLRNDYNIRFMEDRLETEKKKSRYLSDKMEFLLKISECLLGTDNLLIRKLDELNAENIFIYGEKEISVLLYSYLNDKNMKVRCVDEKESLYKESDMDTSGVLLLCTLTGSQDLKGEIGSNFSEVLIMEDLMNN